MSPVVLFDAIPSAEPGVHPCFISRRWPTLVEDIGVGFEAAGGGGGGGVFVDVDDDEVPAAAEIDAEAEWSGCRARRLALLSTYWGPV